MFFYFLLTSSGLSLQTQNDLDCDGAHVICSAHFWDISAVFLVSKLAGITFDGRNFAICATEYRPSIAQSNNSLILWISTLSACH